MATFANITPTANNDGMLYASSVPLTSTEADLFNGTAALDGQDPIQVIYGQAIQAIVTLTPTGGLTAQNSYVVMQTDLGDGVWVDAAWCVYTDKSIQGIFVLSGGISGANSVQQTRQANSFPTTQANGSNQITLGGRVRFVGKTIISGGSSAAVGAFTGVNCTIRYRLLGLR